MRESIAQTRMKGGIRKRGDSYTIAISLGKDPNTGKYKYHYETVSGTREQAKKRRAELINQLDNGTFVKPSKLTVAEHFQRWLIEYAKPNLSPRGFERYESIVRVYIIPNLGNITLTQLKPEQIQKHYTSMLSKGLSALTVRYHHTVLHKALQTANKWGLLSRNAADGVDIPRSRRKDMQTHGMTSRFAISLKSRGAVPTIPYSIPPSTLVCGVVNYWRCDGETLTFRKSMSTAHYSSYKTAAMC